MTLTYGDNSKPFERFRTDFPSRPTLVLLVRALADGHSHSEPGNTLPLG
jgi:hypothetical protein